MLEEKALVQMRRIGYMEKSRGTEHGAGLGLRVSAI
jgi:hypothetical protein